MTPEREWMKMRPEDFDTDVEPALFEVDIPVPPAVDGCDTGDLLELFEDDPPDGAQKTSG